MLNSVSIRRFFLFGFFAAASCFAASTVRAQGYLQSPEWIEVGTLGAAHHNVSGLYSAFYFFDAIHGVAATSASEIYYIADPSEGAWDLATFPTGFTTVRMFRFIQGKLYAATDGADALVSNDSGKTWSYSGLRLGNANDIYADASGNLHALTSPMIRFARIDTLHCVAVGGGSIFVSNDGGLNWKTAVTGLDTTSIGAFGDPCKKVFICPSTWGTAALRSIDSGQTWQDVLTGAGPLSEYIVGASTTCYLNNTEGMFRSIDDGVTWTSIITVNSGPHFPMFVWGPMGEQAVISYSWQWGYEPWMTSTGGDDNLHSAVAVTDSNGAPLMQEDTMNIPFRLVSFCNSFTIPLAFEADVQGLSVKATLTNASGGDYSVLGSDTMSFPTALLNEHYSQDTMWLSYTPHHLVDTALITFENHWQCSDWTETRTVIVTSIPSASIIPPGLIAGNCHPVRGAAIASLDSCTTLIVDSVTIPASMASRLSVTVPDTLRPGSDSLFFTFNPLDTIGTISDSVKIFAHFNPSAGLDSTLNYFNFNLYLTGDSDFSYFEQTIPIEVAALASGIAFVASDSAVELHRASYCQQELDTVLAFQNNGCTLDTVTLATLNGLGFSTPSLSFPIIVPSDSALRIPVHFLAPDTGNFQGAITVTATSGNSVTLNVLLAGTGFPHTGSLAVNYPSIDFDTTYLCQERDTAIVLQDTGCDSVCISSISLLGTGFTMSGNGPVCLQSGETDTIRLHTAIDTTGAPISNMATITVQDNGYVPLQPVVLSREIRYPVEWSLHLSPSQRASADSMVTFQMIQNGTLPADVDSLDFAISYDGDLLTFDTALETWLHLDTTFRTADGREHRVFEIDSIPSDSTLATVSFTAFVAKNLQTNLTIDSVYFHSSIGRSANCIASMGGAKPQSTFSLIPACGTTELSGFLRTGQILIDNIEPNPATSEIRVTVTSPADASTECELSIVDALGRTVAVQPVEVAPGTQTVPVLVDIVPSGIYTVLLHNAEFHSMKKFVKE